MNVSSQLLKTSLGKHDMGFQYVLKLLLLILSIVFLVKCTVMVEVLNGKKILFEPKQMNKEYFIPFAQIRYAMFLTFVLRKKEEKCSTVRESLLHKSSV